MSDENKLNIQITADASSAIEAFNQVGDATDRVAASTIKTEDVIKEYNSAMAEYNAAAAKGADVAAALGAAFDKATRGGATATEGMRQAVTSLQPVVTYTDLTAAALSKLSTTQTEVGTSAIAAGEKVRALATSYGMMAAASAAMEGPGLEYAATLNAVIDAQAKATTQTKAATEATEAQAAAFAAEIESMTAVQAAYRQLAIAQLESNTAGRNRSSAYTQVGTTQGPESVAILAAAEQESAEASESLSLAKKNLADAIRLETAATIPAAEAVNILSESEGRSSVTSRGMGAATGMAANEMRVLEGSTMGAARVMGQFAVQSLGLGPILQSAFSVFALLAFGEIAADVGKKIYDAFDMGGERARKTNADIHAVSVSLDHMNAALQVDIDKEEEAQAKSDKKPFYGLKLSLDEASLAAANLQEKLDGVIKREIDVLKEKSGSFGEQLLGLKGSTKEEQDALGDLGTALSNAKNIDEQRMILGQKSIELHSHLNKLISDQKNSDEQAAASESGMGRNNQNRIEATKSAIDTINKLYEASALTQTKQQKEPIVNTHPKIPGAETAMGKLEEPLAQMKLTRDVSASEEEAYWAKVLATQKQGTSVYTQVLNREASATERARREKETATEAAVRAASEAAKRQGEIQQQQDKLASGPVKQPADALKVTLDAQEASHTAVLDQIKLQEELQTAQSKTRLYQSAGTEASDLNKQKALHAQAASEDVDYYAKRKATIEKGYADEIAAATTAATKQAADREAAKNAQLAALEPLKTGTPKEQASYATQSGAINQTSTLANVTTANTEAAKIVEIEKRKNQQLSELDKQRQKSASEASKQQVTDAQKSDQQIVDRWKDATTKMNSAFTSGVNEWMTTNKGFGRSMDDMAKHMAVTFIDHLLEMQLHHMETQLMMSTTNAAGNATRTAQDKASDTQSQFSGAKVAAVKAFNAFANIPVVGPVLGAAAAAAAFAFCLAFDNGGIMPYTGMALVHQDEGVLTAPTTKMLKNVNAMVNNNSQGGNTSSHSSTFNYNPTYHGVNTPEKHSQRDFTRQAHRAMRLAGQE